MTFCLVSYFNAKLRDRIGVHHVTIHCVAHNPELAVTDAIKVVPCYLLFTQKGERAATKSVSYLISTGFVLVVSTIQWLASQHRALLALKKHYAVTVYNLEISQVALEKMERKLRGTSRN